MINRKRYLFPKERRSEREREAEGACEKCARETELTGHHIISCYIAYRNPILIPKLIRKTENLIMLCKSCHKKADEEQRTWDRDEIGIVAWSLFGLDPTEVADAQEWSKADEEKRKKHEEKKRRKIEKKKARNRTIEKLKVV